MLRRALGCAVATVLCGPPAFAETDTDAASQVEALVHSFGQVLVEHVTVAGFPIKAHRFRIPEYMTATNISVVSSTNPSFGNPTVTSLPTIPIGGRFIWTNCTSGLVQMYSGQVQISQQRTVTTSISEGITNTNGWELNLSYKAPTENKGGFDFGGKLTGSRSSATITIDQNSYASTWQFQDTVTVSNLPV
jgi:hypothetical protein